MTGMRSAKASAKIGAIVPVVVTAGLANARVAPTAFPPDRFPLISVAAATFTPWRTTYAHVGGFEAHWAALSGGPVAREE